MFDERTAEFAVFTADHKPRTYFIPRRPADAIEQSAGPGAQRAFSSWLPLTSDDIDTVVAYFTSQRPPPGRFGMLTIDGLLAEWRAALNDVWYGYLYSPDDYTNDLVLRDMLQDVLDLLDGEPRRLLGEKLDAWDAGFRQVTFEARQPLPYLLGTTETLGHPHAWWWGRAPLAVDPAQGWNIDAAAEELPERQLSRSLT